ncbi:MAG: hypothetical protein ACE14V_01335 [bacterium]
MYVKYHDPWTEGTDKLSAQSLNHIGTQHPELITIFDAHNHDTTHYTKTLADDTFFSTSFMGLDSGFDAEYLDGQSLNQIVGTSLPVGSIMWWGGNDGDVPSGWVICNGQTGTDDFRNKFIVGSGSTYSIGNTGGSLTANISGSVSVADHILVGDEMPLHTHTFDDKINGYSMCAAGDAGTGACSLSTTSDSRTTGSAGGGGGHNHTGNSITLNSIDITPAYYALFLIKRLS